MTKLSGGLYWALGMDRWVELAQGIPSLSLGIPFSLLMGWVNDGAVAVQGRVKLIVTKPDGSQVGLSAVANQDKSAQPGNGWLVQFNSVTLDQLGDYRADATLEVQGIATGLWDGVLWLVSVNDQPTDWGWRFDYLSDTELFGSEDRRIIWGTSVNPSPAPYTWMSLGSIATPQNVTRIRITATDNGSPIAPDVWRPSSPVFLMFFKPPGRSLDPAQQGLNMTGRIYITESGQFNVILGQTM